MGYNIGDRPTNEIPGVNLDSYYALSGTTVTQGRILILAFVNPEIEDYVGYLSNIQSIINAHPGNNIIAIGILYNTTIISTMNFLDYQDALTVAGVNFLIINNGNWPGSAAQNYTIGITATPFVYIVSKYYTIAYKNIPSTDISTNVGELLKGPKITGITPAVPTYFDPLATPAYYNNLTTVDITFSETAKNANVNGNYIFGGPGRGTKPVDPALVTSIGVNQYRLTFGAGSWGDGDFTITITGVTDSLYYDPAPLVSPVITYKMDITAPVVNSASISGGIVHSSATASVTIDAFDSASGIAGYCITGTHFPPTSGWSTLGTISVTLTHGGTNTFYAWVKDNAGNISAVNDNSWFSIVYKIDPWNDVVLRKYKLDAGAIPATGVTICASPDIICSGTSNVNPAPPYDSDGHFEAVVVNQKNYFFVRIKNAGVDVINDNQAECYLYYTPSSLFMTPSSWVSNPMSCNTPSGYQHNNPFPVMNSLDVKYAKYPFEWTPTTAQSAEHHCVISVCKTPKFPWDGVNLPHIKTADDFYFWIRHNPNVCFHNVSFTTVSSGGTGGANLRSEELISLKIHSRKDS